jgi:hypothetical protein
MTDVAFFFSRRTVRRLQQRMEELAAEKVFNKGSVLRY